MSSFLMDLKLPLIGECGNILTPWWAEDTDALLYMEVYLCFINRNGCNHYRRKRWGGAEDANLWVSKDG